MKNNFKNIKGYNGLYKINSDGVIKSYHFNREKIMKSSINKKGYSVLYLSNGKRKMYSVHRLVAQTFIPNPSNLPEINHKDSIKYNNQVDNLEWCTKSMNIKHSFNTGLRTVFQGINHFNAKLTDNEVRDIKFILKNYKRGMINELAEKYNVKRQTITNIKRNTHWKHIK